MFCQYLYCTQQEVDDNGQPVYWGPGDYLNGSLFTNGYINTKYDSSQTPPAPIFYGTVNYAGATSSQISPSAIPNYNSGGMPSEFIQPPYLPQHADQPYSPPSANEIAGLKAIAMAQGKYYQGRTRIWLHGNQMDVENGGTKTLNIPLPANGVIFVDGSTDESDPLPLNDNYFSQNAAGTYYVTDKFNTSYGNVFVSGELQGQLTIYAANNIYLTGADPTNDTPPTDTTKLSKLVFYSNDSFTPKSDDTGVTTDSTDMLGLIANNYVMILRYGWPTGSTPGYTGIDPVAGTYNDYSPNCNTEIDAAIMALHNSFLYEGYWPSDIAPDITNPAQLANAYQLTINGAVIQNNRGGVSSYILAQGGSGSTQLGCGYLKNYWFDARMQYESPPYFLLPGNSGWGISDWAMTSNPSNLEFPPWTGIEGAAGIAVSAQGSATLSPGTAMQLSATLIDPATGNPVTTWTDPSTGQLISIPETVTWSISGVDGASVPVGTTIDPNGLLTAGTPGSGSGSVMVDVTATSNVYPGLVSQPFEVTINAS